MFDVLKVESSLDSVHELDLTFSAENLDTNILEYGIFISEAEKQTLSLGGRNFFTGKYQDIRLLANKWDNRHFRISTDLLADQTFSIRLENLSKSKISVHPKIIPYTRVERGIIEKTKLAKRGTLFSIFFLGAIFIFLVYTIGLTIQTRNPDFKYYSFYLGAIFIHNALQADAFLKTFLLFPSNPVMYVHLNEFLQCYIYILFMLFIKVFLEIKLNMPNLSRIVNVSIIATLSFSFIFLLTSTLTHNFRFIQETLSFLWLVIAALGAVIVVGVYRKSDNPVKHYILVGSIFLLIGSFLELFTSLEIDGAYNWNLYATPPHGWFPFNYTQLAILLEIICFALAIGHKIRKQEIAFSDLQQKEIDELKTKEKNIELERLLLNKELTALRSQMNPHFIFNGLSSVNNMVMKEDAKSASKYLTKFAKLMRLTLNNSKQMVISLEQELKTLSLYVDLENIRFGEQFSYKVSVPQELLASRIFLPSMILQPYIENAIKHGLSPLKGKGEILLAISSAGEKLTIIIEDNGIGRLASQKSKNTEEQIRKSYGMEITANRVDLLNKIYDLDAGINVEDLSPGTRVIITLKKIHDPQQLISSNSR